MFDNLRNLIIVEIFSGVGFARVIMGHIINEYFASFFTKQVIVVA